EMIPTTLPVLSMCVEDVKTVAKEALHNRPEIQQGFDQLRAAVVRRDMQKNEKWPTLNLIAELMLGDIQPNKKYGDAYKNQFGDTGYLVGFQFEQAIDNDEDRARLLRREIELRQQSNQLKTTIDTVLLEAIVSYRELMTAFRDMEGKYRTLEASREELRQLRDRLEVDTEAEGGRTTATQLQLILDSMERNSSAEEAFLDSVVAYNASFAALERAKGTVLRKEGVEIERTRDTDPTHVGEDVEVLKITKSAPQTGKGGKNIAPGKNGVATPCGGCGSRTYGNPTCCPTANLNKLPSFTRPAPRAKVDSADKVIESTIKEIERIPLEDLPSVAPAQDASLFPNTSAPKPPAAKPAPKVSKPAIKVEPVKPKPTASAAPVPPASSVKATASATPVKVVAPQPKLPSASAVARPIAAPASKASAKPIAGPKPLASATPIR
ncbi:MAG: TolC family protein, partial [Verrucomicrobiota bacterium]